MLRWATPPKPWIWPLERGGANTCALLDVCTENDSSGIVAARKIKEAHPEVKVGDDDGHARNHVR